MPTKKPDSKPKKPYPDFPLFPHATKRWAKKIKGKLHYFGPWSDPDGALEKYLRDRDELQAGRTPRAKSEGISVAEVVNRFLDAKRHLVDTRELSPKTFNGYLATGKRVTDFFGRNRPVDDLHADDFERFRAKIAGRVGPVSLAADVRHTRIIFKYAFDAGLIVSPVGFGPTFKLPSKRGLRQVRHAAGEKMFEANEVRELLAFFAGETITRPTAMPGAEPQKIVGKASPALRAMTLLGLNAGFGQNDCATLPQSALDLAGGWVNYPRPKTSVPRRVPLWPETIQAIQEAIDARPEAKKPDDESLVFLTTQGQPWVRMKLRKDVKPGQSEWVPLESLGMMFSRRLDELGLKRPGLAFYSLRRTFETIGGEARDQPAVDCIMGHDDYSMASVYRQRIGDDRLRAVVDHVRGWLFGPAVRPAGENLDD